MATGTRRPMAVLVLIWALLGAMLGAALAGAAEGGHADHVQRRLVVETSQSALEEFCVDLLHELPSNIKIPGQQAVQFAVVVIPVRNPRQLVLLESIKSIISSSMGENLGGVRLKQIIIADDGSSVPVSGWDGWAQFPSGLVAHVRSNSEQGFAKAKNRAVDSISLQDSEKVNTMVLFTPPAIASPRFLLPLAHSLAKYPRALVYPVEDVLVTTADQESLEIIPADTDLVAGFDWQFRLEWESADRVKSADAGHYEVLSPSVPHAFSALYSTLRAMGPVDDTLHAFSESLVADNIEYALRTWLCGGTVIKQQCSRLALLHPNFQASVALERQSAREVDQNVMNIATKWMQTPVVASPGQKAFDGDAALLADVNTYKEIAFQARFLNRIPYAVETLVDPIKLGPLQSSLFPDPTHGVPTNGGLVCTDFKWFLREVYPGLEADIAKVVRSYHSYIMETDFLGDRMKELHTLHYSRADGLDTTPKALSSLLLREETLYQHARQALKIDKPMESVKQVFHEPPPVLAKVNLDDIVADHSDHVRQSLACEDVTYQNYCQTRVGVNADVRQFCDDHKTIYVFACPKICGYCDNGKFCEDMYLRKCVTWAEEGKCGTEDKDYGNINSVCRKSCGVCTPDYLKSAAAAASKQAAPRTTQPPPAAVPVKADANAEGESVDVHIAHADFVRGMISDADVRSSISQPDNCENVKRSSDGRLLDRIRISNERHDEVKLFCGIYTIATVHETNVRATRNTWAKKCDGFTAFSNKLDPLIPAIELRHEGEESYNNMWQKSRSIWKHIYAHHLDEFDFFLLGGDDMMYIVENLKAYLASDEIQKAKDRFNGLYLGRIFAPPNQVVFNSGGAGYILDKKALRALGEMLDSPKCFPHQVGFWEDVNTANCLKASGITPYDTRDPQERERFHPFNPGNHLDYRVPAKNPDWYPKYSPHLKVGFECCSEQSVSFHYLKHERLYALYDYLYNCPNRAL